jgi:hypothetical protein
MFDGTLEMSSLYSPDAPQQFANMIDGTSSNLMSATAVKSSLEYDESEGVSDTSFASESGCSMKSRPNRMPVRNLSSKIAV